MQETPTPSSGRERWVTIASVGLVVALLGAMVFMVVQPTPSPENPQESAPYAVSPTAIPTPGNPPIALHTPATRAAGQIDLTTNPFVAIARDSSPSVVGVSNKIRWYTSRNGDTQDVEQGTGSGVILSQDGYIVTNQHVVEGAESLWVVLSDGREVEAQLIGQDVLTDIAVLKIEESGLVPITVGDSSQVQVGEFALAIGSPLGNELLGSVTMGIISATQRTLTLDERRIELIQTDAAINPGNSGGALINIHGELIGINTVKFFYAGRGMSTEGLGFAIPINNALPIIQELIDKGKVERPVLGISLDMLGEYLNREQKLPASLRGALIRTVYEGSPAHNAGLRAGDVITHVGGEAIEVFADLSSSLSERSFGEEVELTVYRDGRSIGVLVTLTPFAYPE